MLDAAALEAALDGLTLDLSPGLPRTGSLWRRIAGLMGGFRGPLALGIAATVAIQLLGLVAPALTRVVMNRALPDGDGQLLVLVAAGTVLMALFHAWIAWVRGRALLFFSQRVGAAAERGFLEHILALPFPRLRGRSLGEWLQAFGAFASARDLLAEGTLGALLDGALALVLLAAMTWILPGAAATVALAALAAAAATLVSGRAQAWILERETEAAVAEQGFLSECLAGIATLKAAGAEDRALGRWARMNRRILALGLRRGRIGLGVGTALGGLGHGVDAALLIWGGLQVVRGSLDLGTFLAFLQLASAFTAAVLALSGTCLAFMALRPQLARASDVLSLEVPAPPPRQAPSPRPERLVMRDVWFRYAPDRPWILKGFDLEVAPGEKHRLAQPSGWGKTTLLRLLAGLEAPTRGEVLLGDRPPAAVPHALLYLPQFVEPFGGTILENLALLSGGAPPEALVRAAAASGFDTILAGLPMGLKTPLPHRGRSLSGGQRQWLALTAALGAGRGVLILDEPLANLDPAAAAALLGLLEAGPWTLVMAGHTTPRPEHRSAPA